MKIKYMFRIIGTTIMHFAETKKDLLNYAKINYPHLKDKWEFSKCKKNGEYNGK